MIGKNIMEVISTIDMRKALIKSFRASLAKLTFATERTNEDVRHQIVTILSSLESKAFISAISSILQIMQADLQSRAGSKTEFQLGSEAAEDHLLMLTGTFQGALHMQILNTISDSFAAILSHVDRNNNLFLLLDSNLEFLWQYLFKISFNPKNVVVHNSNNNTSNAAKLGNRGGKSNALRSRATKDTLVKSDGFANNPFSSKFPFSFYLCPLLDSMRNSTQHAAEHQLRGQFSTMGMELGLADDIDAVYIGHYVHDLVCIKCRPVVGLTRESQSQLVIQILEMMGAGHSALPDAVSNEEHSIAATTASSPVRGEEHSTAGMVVETSEDHNTAAAAAISTVLEQVRPLYSQQANPRLSCLASVHHRFWKIERIIDLYFELMNNFAPVLPRVLAFFQEKRSELDDGSTSSPASGPAIVSSVSIDGTVHKQLLDIFLESLEPWTGLSWDWSSSLSSSGGSSSMTAGSSHNGFDAWLLQVDSAHSHVHSLVDLIEDHTLRTQIKLRWSRIGTVI